MRHSICLLAAIAASLSLSALGAPVGAEESRLTARDETDSSEGGGGGTKSHIIIPLVVLPVLAVLSVVFFAIFIWRRAASQRARRLSALDVKLSARSTTSTAGADSRPDSFVQAVDAKRHSRRPSSSDALLAGELGRVFGEPPASPPAAKTREHRTGSALTPLPEQ